jgi:transposase
MEYIALDVHKKYTWARVENTQGDRLYESRLQHAHGTIKNFVHRWSEGSPVAVETVGNWYWVVEENRGRRRQAAAGQRAVGQTDDGHGEQERQAGCEGDEPAAKKRNPACGLDSSVFGSRCPRAATHPYGAQPAENATEEPVHATLGKYGLVVEEVTDAFGKKGRQILAQLMAKLPPHTEQALGRVLDQLDHVCENLQWIEGKMLEVFAPCPQTTLLKTLPGVGDILAVVIWTEIGTLERFGRAEQLASYCGLVARENSSGGKIRFGAVRRDVNVYLKWTFVEAANSAVLNAERCGYGHIGRLYQRIKTRRGHGKAKVAVARHLSEAAFWMLKKGESYREPMSSTQR